MSSNKSSEVGVVDMDQQVFKVVMIGGTSVGKSAIFRRYMMGDFDED